MPYPSAAEHPERTPCINTVRGSSEGVKEAAKNSVPRRRPPVEIIWWRRSEHATRQRSRCCAQSARTKRSFRYGHERPLTAAVVQHMSFTVRTPSVGVREIFVPVGHLGILR